MSYLFPIFWTTGWVLLRKPLLFFVLMTRLLLFPCESKEQGQIGNPSPKPSEAHLTSVRSHLNADPASSRSHLIADQDNYSSIDVLVKDLYESITFCEEGQPNLDRLCSLFIPKSPFIRITPEGVHKMNLESFVLSFSERVKTGALKSFYEAEISRKTHAYGRIAQVFSTYKKGMNTEDPASFIRGINGIQLYYDGQRWWIISLLWEDERSDNPIPEEYLR